MSAVVAATAGATAERRAASSQPRDRATVRVSVLHIKNTTIIKANMIPSPPTHITAPPACTSPSAVPAQAGRGPIGRPGALLFAPLRMRPVKVSTGMTRNSRTILTGYDKRHLIGSDP